MSATKTKQNPALRLLGLPNLPTKLPSRNWLIFWGVSTSFAAAIIYDRREKRKATARWAAAVSPLAKEAIPNPSAMPRKITVFLESPPGDGLRAAQNHFSEYVKPILASSGLDWEFVVGRRQGDVRAVVAERVRRVRRTVEQVSSATQPDLATDEDAIESIRKRNGITEYEGVRGDLVIGRHTWKEYVRGLHEGWLGPLFLPELPVQNADPESTTPTTHPGSTGAVDSPSLKPLASGLNDATVASDDNKPKQPVQPQPYNAPDQYPSSPLPRFIPAELTPSVAVPFPHLLGFFNTPTRLGRFLNRRKLADDIGREVASVCFCTYHEYRETIDGYEQDSVLKREERDWVKTVWKEERGSKTEESKAVLAPPKERLWASPVVMDPRIASRMRQFYLTPENEQQARQIVVPEEKIEGWAKGKLRHLGLWISRKWNGDRRVPYIGDLDDAE